MEKVMLKWNVPTLTRRTMIVESSWLLQEVEFFKIVVLLVQLNSNA